ncbi:MAG: hypothetical protein A3G09_04780 [Candidatus Moranbacteria bacterium RIFCSPLOWO2_12_FULL_48_12]|nr:MAG: hypothetical protein A3G09_04780 [Candidatus Moranbacteria bacterium RIFCSPLOWO2_12_FULL_48_12]
MDERNSKFRDHEAMLILGIPDIVVRELVDVHVEVTIGVHIDVRDVETCTKPSLPPPLEYSWD